MDSTFRIIQLLMDSELTVQPHYIVDSEESTGIEIDTMNNIRRLISRESTGIRSRFLPTRYISAGAIQRDPEIQEYVDALKKKQKVSEQYVFMANYCKQTGIDRIEVALTNISGEKDTFQLFKDSPAFRYFLYPTIHYSKPEMYQMAKQKGWDAWLDMTSFCRRPRISIRQCGTCGPCVDAVMAGMGRRLPIVPRIKAHLQIPFRKYWRKHYQEKSHTRLFRYIERRYLGRL